MSAVKLPRAIEDKLGELAAQVRRLWVVRGLGWFALVLLASAAAAVLLDARLDLSGGGRGLLLGGWLTVAAVAGWRWVWRPARSPLPVPLLAAAIEEKFPSLAERLTTLVELSETFDAGNGSRALIDVLAKDTAQRTKRLNFGRAAPTASATRAGLLAGGVAILVLSPLVLVPGAAERVRRFLLPWYTPRVEVPYRVVVSSGSPVVKRGRPVTLSGFLERSTPDAVLPDAAVLVYREAGADAEKKLPMAGDDKAAFAVTRPDVKIDFEYCVEAGAARSDWHAVAVVDPVELADGTATHFAPPAYARPTHPEQKVPGLQEFEAIQYTEVRFELKFDRPAKAAYFEWKPAAGGGVVGTDRSPVRLTADRTGGTADWTLIDDGTLKLILVGDRDVTTEATAAVRAVPDAPPKFEKAVNVDDRPRDVRPGERIPLELAVADDLKVEKVQLEYAVNGAEAVQVVPVPLKDVGTPRADGRFAFDLTGRASEGDVVRFRVRAFDNRSVPEHRKEPQQTVVPEKGWATVRLSASAKPLAEQAITAQKDAIKEKLEELAKQAADALEQAGKLQKEGRGKPALGPAEVARLESARNAARDAARGLDELAREVALTPDLRPLADAIKGVADRPLRQADDALRAASNEAAPDPRDKHVGTAVGHLDDAVNKLHELIRGNERVAQNRLDRDALDKLVEGQKKLADEAGKKAADPKAAAELAKRQQQVRDELRDLLAKNETLRKAVEDMTAEQARDLADETKRLAAAQKDLDKAKSDLDAAARKQAMDDVAKRQKDLNDRADHLAGRTQPQAAVAQAQPLDRTAFDKAADQLSKADAVGALTEQEKAARELDRLAAELERAAAARKDPREAARQLAKLQDELRKKLADATKDQPFDKLPAEQRDQLTREQEAVRKAAAAVAPPAGDAAAQKAKADAAAKLDRTKESLEQTPADAADRMQQSADALRKMADAMPSREQRLAKARDELERLSRDQDAVRREAEEKGKGFDKKTPDAAARKDLADRLADAAKKQADIADKLDAIDAPGLEGRKRKAADAARRAADDMKAGLPQDVPASQQDARRQLDRLRQAADGQKPADELADELAKKQERVADAARKAGGAPTPQQRQEMQELEREIADKLGGIKDADAAERLNRAKEAARAAADAAAKPDADEIKKKTQQAADELNKLADDLAGTESPADRAERLSRERQQAAERVEKNSGKPGDADATAAAKAELERQEEELRQTRAGQAQEAKKAAADALEKLRKTPNPEKNVGLQKQAAEATKRLADQMKGNGDRTAKGDRGQPDDAPDDAGGSLPSKADADAAKDLAREQREVRDQLAKANEEAAKGTPPTDNAGIEKLAREQQQLADQAAGIAKQDGAGGRAAAQAAEAGKKAADRLKAGAPEQAQAAGEMAKQHLDEAAKESGDKKAGEMAAKQGELNKRMAEAAGDRGAAAAQQQARQGELAKQADGLADKLDAAAKDAAPGTGKGDPESLKKAGEAAREAGGQMDRAARESAAGRQPNAADAREKANAAMERAESHAAAAGGQKPGDARPDPNAKEAGQAARQADKEMGEAGQKLGGKDAKGAQQAMEKAAENLEKAADKLGQAGGGPTPGGNDGSGNKPVSTDVPADLQQYLGRPWGELPGDVKSKIIQDLKAKYGEDYARVIKLYFEQIADRK